MNENFSMPFQTSMDYINSKESPRTMTETPKITAFQLGKSVFSDNLQIKVKKEILLEKSDFITNKKRRQTMIYRPNLHNQSQK
jgi:hypothetical protein